MGIQNFKNILKEYLYLFPTISHKKLSFELGTKAPINLYFDGNVLLYYGRINTNIVDGRYDEELMATYTVKHVNRFIAKCYKYDIKINNIYMYFDGTRPAQKEKTSKKRKIYNNNIPINMSLLKYLFTKYLHEDIPNIIIQHFMIGESEHECFIRRDINIPSLIVTSDSDIFHIAYDYNKLSNNDYIYTTNSKFEYIYNLSEFRISNIPPLVFRILMMLRGSDFTPNLFTVSSILAMINLFSKNKFKVYILEGYINEILSITDKYKNIEYNIRRKISNISPMTYNDIAYITDHTGYKAFNDQKKLIQQNGIYKIDDIKQILILLVKILIYLYIYNNISEKRIILNNTKISSNNNTTFNQEYVDRYVKSLHWAVNYSFLGSYYDEYFTAINNTISITKPFNMYIYLLGWYNTTDNINKTLTLNSFKTIINNNIILEK